MREFTEEDFVKLREEIQELKIENKLFEDEDFEGKTLRTFLFPVIRVNSPEDEESLNYSKQILNFLIDNYYTVSLGRVLSEGHNTDMGNYSISVVEKFDKKGNQNPSEIFLTVNRKK